MNEIRLRRVESLLREKVSTLIMMRELKDPRVDSSVTLTRVKVAKDIASARIWVSSFGGEEATKRAVEGLNNATGFIQMRIGGKIRIRNTPRLFFIADYSMREGIRVNQLIDQVMNKKGHE